MAEYTSNFVWIVFLVAVSFLIPLVLYKEFLLSVGYFIILFSIFLVMIQSNKQKKLFKDLNAKIDGLMLKSIKAGFEASPEDETKILVNEFSTELKLEEYKAEQEKKYREISRKILELDNKIDEKFDLLGKAILKISKEKETKSHT